MKVTHLILTAAVAFATLAFTAANVVYNVDKQQTKITWVGKKITGEHTGNINVSEGKLTSDGKSIIGGFVSIDMNSMTCTDLTDAEYNGKLIGHLKSDDFFSTEKHPKATLEITKSVAKEKDQYTISGNLTIKGISKPIEFPATVQVSADQVKATAKIVVDRTKYDIKYGSASFFDSLGDKAISNDFELNVVLVAKK